MGGTELTQEYLEKFFPVTVRLPAPDAAMVGRLFKTKVSKRFSEHPSWFAGTNEENKFTELLNQLWDDCISRVCTNLRKAGLLTNDIFIAARLIEREVDALDLIAIESLRRFFPDVYESVRRKPAFLTYENGWDKGRYFMRDDKKEADAKKFFDQIGSQIAQHPDADAAKGLLSFMFPAYDKGRRELLHSLSDKAAEQLAFAVSSHAHDYAYDLMNIGEAARALNIVFEVAQKLAGTPAVQRALRGAMIRAGDDTFALRL